MQTASSKNAARAAATLLHWRRTRRHIFAVVVAVMSCAWLNASSHCAIAAAAMPQESKSGSDRCPMHAPRTPVKKDRSPQSDTPCCKTLRATITSKSSAVQSEPPIELPPFEPISGAANINFRPENFAPGNKLDTGPPVQPVVNQLIRSMRAHAPPLAP